MARSCANGRPPNKGAARTDLGYSVGVRRDAPIVFLAVMQAFVAATAALFYGRARISVAAAFAEYGTPMPAWTAVAVSPVFLPAVVGGGVLLTAVALLFVRRRSRKTGLLAVGLILSSFALVFAVLASFLPLFQPLA